jgi:hypothetical protein
MTQTFDGGILDKTVDGEAPSEDLKHRTRMASLVVQEVVRELGGVYGLDATLNALLTVYVQAGLYVTGEPHMQRVAAALPQMISEFMLATAEPAGNG